MDHTRDALIAAALAPDKRAPDPAFAARVRLAVAAERVLERSRRARRREGFEAVAATAALAGAGAVLALAPQSAAGFAGSLTLVLAMAGFWWATAFAFGRGG